MTALYGSQAMPKEVFGEGILLKTFENVMESVAPAVWELNKYWLGAGNPEATSYHWEMMDGFSVNIKVMVNTVQTVMFLNKPYDIFRKEQGVEEMTRMLSANTTHSLDGMVVRELVRRCSYDPDLIKYVLELVEGIKFIDYSFNVPGNQEMVDKLWGHYVETGYLSIRLFDYLDHNTIKTVDTAVIKEMISTLPKKPFKVLTVHDCFRCLPQYGNDLRRQYNIQLATIAKSDILSSLISQVRGTKITIGKLDPDLWKDIEETEYALS